MFAEFSYQLKAFSTIYSVNVVAILPLLLSGSGSIKCLSLKVFLSFLLYSLASYSPCPIKFSPSGVCDFLPSLKCFTCVLSSTPFLVRSCVPLPLCQIAYSVKLYPCLFVRSPNVEPFSDQNDFDFDFDHFESLHF